MSEAKRGKCSCGRKLKGDKAVRKPTCPTCGLLPSGCKCPLRSQGKIKVLAHGEVSDGSAWEVWQLLA